MPLHAVEEFSVLNRCGSVSIVVSVCVNAYCRVLLWLTSYY